MEPNMLPYEERLMAYLDGELSESDRAHIDKMLDANPAARQLVEELRILNGALHSLPSYQLEADFCDRVLRLAEREMLRGQRASGGAERNGDQPVILPSEFEDPFATLPLRTSPQGGLAARLSRPMVWASLAAAAALVVMIFSPERFSDTRVALHDSAPAPTVPAGMAGLLGPVEARDMAVESESAISPARAADERWADPAAGNDAPSAPSASAPSAPSASAPLNAQEESLPVAAKESVATGRALEKTFEETPHSLAAPQGQAGAAPSRPAAAAFQPAPGKPGLAASANGIVSEKKVTEAELQRSPRDSQTPADGPGTSPEANRSEPVAGEKFKRNAVDKLAQDVAPVERKLDSNPNHGRSPTGAPAFGGGGAGSGGSAAGNAVTGKAQSKEAQLQEADAQAKAKKSRRETEAAAAVADPGVADPGGGNAGAAHKALKAVEPLNKAGDQLKKADSAPVEAAKQPTAASPPAPALPRQDADELPAASPVPTRQSLPKLREGTDRGATPASQDLRAAPAAPAAPPPAKTGATGFANPPGIANTPAPISPAPISPAPISPAPVTPAAVPAAEAPASAHPSAKGNPVSVPGPAPGEAAAGFAAPGAPFQDGANDLSRGAKNKRQAEGKGEGKADGKAFEGGAVGSPAVEGRAAAAKDAVQNRANQKNEEAQGGGNSESDKSLVEQRQNAGPGAASSVPAKKQGQAKQEGEQQNAQRALADEKSKVLGEALRKNTGYSGYRLRQQVARSKDASAEQEQVGEEILVCELKVARQAWESGAFDEVLAARPIVWSSENSGSSVPQLVLPQDASERRKLQKDNSKANNPANIDPQSAGFEKPAGLEQQVLAGDLSEGVFLDATEDQINTILIEMKNRPEAFQDIKVNAVACFDFDAASQAVVLGRQQNSRNAEASLATSVLTLNAAENPRDKRHDDKLAAKNEPQTANPTPANPTPGPAEPLRGGYVSARGYGRAAGYGGAGANSILPSEARALEDQQAAAQVPVQVLGGGGIARRVYCQIHIPSTAQEVVLEVSEAKAGLNPEAIANSDRAEKERNVQTGGQPFTRQAAVEQVKERLRVLREASTALGVQADRAPRRRVVFVFKVVDPSEPAAPAAPPAP